MISSHFSFDIRSLPVDIRSHPVNIRSLPVVIRPLLINIRPLPVDIRSLPAVIRSLLVDIRSLSVDIRSLSVNIRLKPGYFRLLCFRCIDSSVNCFCVVLIFHVIVMDSFRWYTAESVLAIFINNPVGKTEGIE